MLFSFLIYFQRQRGACLFSEIFPVPDKLHGAGLFSAQMNARSFSDLISELCRCMLTLKLNQKREWYVLALKLIQHQARLTGADLDSEKKTNLPYTGIKTAP